MKSNEPEKSGRKLEKMEKDTQEAWTHMKEKINSSDEYGNAIKELLNEDLVKITQYTSNEIKSITGHDVTLTLGSSMEVRFIEPHFLPVREENFQQMEKYFERSKEIKEAIIRARQAKQLIEKLFGEEGVFFLVLGSEKNTGNISPTRFQLTQMMDRKEKKERIELIQEVLSQDIEALKTIKLKNIFQPMEPTKVNQLLMEMRKALDIEFKKLSEIIFEEVKNKLRYSEEKIIFLIKENFKQIEERVMDKR